MPKGGSRTRGWLFALFFFAAACLFKQTMVILAAGLLAWLCFAVFVRRDRRVIVCLAASLIGLGIFEVGGRWIISRKVGQVYNLDVLHRMKPWAEPGINGDGIRCHREAHDFTEQTYNIIFLGDSFTFGQGLPSGDDAFPAQVERLCAERYPASDVRAVNFGWTSSSPILFDRLLKKLGPRYKPDLVLLCLDISDFHDDLRFEHMSRPRGISPTVYLLNRLGLERAGGGLWDHVRFGNLFASRDVPRDKYFVANQPLYESLPLMAETEKNIRSIADYTREVLGADFILVLLPRGFQYSARESPRDWEADLYTVLGPHVLQPFAWLKRFAGQVDFPCHTLLDDFRDCGVYPTCFADDFHWNRDGHRVAAGGIMRILEEEGILPRPDGSR